MRQRTHIEQAKFELLKAVRAGIRAKHAIAADRELNEVLPSVEERFDRLVNTGELPEKAAAEAFTEGMQGDD